MENFVHCVGCGAIFPDSAGPIHRYMLAAPACWAMFGELNALLLTDPAAAGCRQWCVDAYAVQHPGEPNDQAIQSVACHLLSLYSTLVLKMPLEKAPGIITRAAARKGHYRWLTPPSAHTMSVVDVLRDRQNLRDAARQWALAAWDAWRPHHEQIKVWHAELFVR